MKIVWVVALSITLFSCKNKEEMTGKTKKGDLISPCVGAVNSPCSDRFNPNASYSKLRKYIS